MSFTTVQMDLAQGKSVDASAFQTIVDGNFGTGNANGIIAGTTYIIKVQNARTYAMSSNGNIATLDKYPIDDNPGVLEQSGDIYTINCIEDLVAFSYNVNSRTELYAGKTVTLGRDLDFKDDLSYADASSKYKEDENGYTPDSSSTTTIKSFMIDERGKGFIAIGNGKTDGGLFEGKFDGNKKSLSNLYMNSSTLGGLFGAIKTDIEISNISLIECNIKGTYPTGGLIGSDNGKVTINNVNVSGKVESTLQAGGIIGIKNSGSIITINNAIVKGNIESKSNYAGGIIGYTNIDLRIENCYNESVVKAQLGAGGITFGTSNSSSNLIILNCHNTGMIEAFNSPAAGVVALNGDNVINCYNTGDIISNSVVGGIGHSNSIINCYNKGNVESTGTMAGGISGYSATITNCYNNGEIKGKSKSGGISGESPTVINCYNFKPVTALSGVVGGIAPSGVINNCYNSGTIKTGTTSPAGGISYGSSTITNSHNTGDIIGEDSTILGEIIGVGNVDNTNDYLIKDTNATNISNAIGKTQAEMNEIMSVQNFVNLMNSYVEENNTDLTKTPLKKWKVENEMPLFAE